MRRWGWGWVLHKLYTGSERLTLGDFRTFVSQTFILPEKSSQFFKIKISIKCFLLLNRLSPI